MMYIIFNKNFNISKVTDFDLEAHQHDTLWVNMQTQSNLTDIAAYLNNFINKSVTITIQNADFSFILKAMFVIEHENKIVLRGEI